MHRGHTALLERADRVASTIALATFDPHPARVLRPDVAPQMLQTPAQSHRVCRQLGVDLLVNIEFTRALANTPAETFVAREIIANLGPAHVVIGRDFRYGAGRAGTPETLCRQLAESGIGCSVVELLDFSDGEAERAPIEAGEKLSSTAIRRCVREGRVEAANLALGRPYALEGLVVHGDARGRQLGFPTANLQYTGLAPAPGVYAGFLDIVRLGRELASTRRRWPAVCNVGSNPTFAASADTSAAAASAARVEVHIMGFDFGSTLYDATVEFCFLARLRDECRFPNAEALISAIEADVAHARALCTPEAADRVASTSVRGSSRG